MSFQLLSRNKETLIAIMTLIMIAVYFTIPWLPSQHAAYADWPLWTVLILGGTPLVAGLLVKVVQGQFGADLLAGISIITSILLGEYLAGALVVLMLSGGEALEAFAVQRASSVLRALSQRMPSIAHRQVGNQIFDIGLDEIQIGDVLLILPQEICPVDGSVLSGHGTMDESYLTGEPYIISKTPGSTVLSGAINGTEALSITAEKLAVDSRYARIMQVMQDSEKNKPRIRRLAEQLGAWYTPLAVLIGVVAWIVSADPVRFLAVMVVATPCPLLIAIPVAIIGSISLAARRAIVVRDPSSLELADRCQTFIFDKTGTLTYGEPVLVGQFVASKFQSRHILSLVGSLERYSKHPLAHAIVQAAQAENAPLHSVTQISERPGKGLDGLVNQSHLEVTSRAKLLASQPELSGVLPPVSGGLECVILVDGQYAATYQFRDQPRAEGRSFISHLGPRHQIRKVMLVSGDRESEVRYLADLVGIENVFYSQSPEQKLELVREEMKVAPTIFIGDGINDAPALSAATVGIAFGQNSDITTEAAGVVILDSSLAKVDEFLHISRRMRRIALESAIGGMALSIAGMGLASAGYLPPVPGAIKRSVTYSPF